MELLQLRSANSVCGAGSNAAAAEAAPRNYVGAAVQIGEVGEAGKLQRDPKKHGVGLNYNPLPPVSGKMTCSLESGKFRISATKQVMPVTREAGINDAKLELRI